MSSPRMDNGTREAVLRVRRLLHGASRPPFLVVNLMEAHSPYYGRGVYSRWRKRVQHMDILGRYRKLRIAVMGGRLPMTDALQRDLHGIYWENVRFLDSQLGILLRNLPRGFLDSGFLIVVSDHGQLLGEKGGLDHVAGLNEELIRVPLVIRPPGGVLGQWIKRPIDITWLFFLLEAIASGREDALRSWLAWAGQQDLVVSEAHGKMVPHTQPLIGRDPIFRKDLLTFRTMHDHPAIACISGRWKLICHLGRREDEVYDIETDSKEDVNLVTREADVLQRLHENLRERYLGESRGTPKEVRRDLLPLRAKKAIAQIVLTGALENHQKPVLVWTGGKDSTLVLYLCLDEARKEGLEVPSLLFVDHDQHFRETWSFTEDIAKREGLQMIVARNEDLLGFAGEGEETVPLESLDPENQEEALKAGLKGTEVPLSLDTPVGNHLLKTVALNRALRKHGFDAVIAGIRWDENPARSNEVFFSPRENPPHTRVHPILPWTEREVWTCTLDSDLPIHPLYKKGYRSFDGVKDSEPTDTRPAWEQDLETSEERAGRAQDKEEIMERLRALGYF
ncbi:MAG: phosphoadenosine phosphosulfate reductase family protein [Thermoplasmata archaeon]